MRAERLEEFPGFGNLFGGMFVILSMTGLAKYFSDGLELAECQSCCSASPRRSARLFCATARLAAVSAQVMGERSWVHSFRAFW